ncbi:MAG: NAD(P)/FAD-dependent oxidoreductase [Sphingobacteriaceae bacterium]
MEEQLTKKIIVVGGGFAGINFIKKLSEDRHFDITLVDTNNYHFFPPLLYQVATAFIEPSNISYPFRRMFQEKPNLRFYLGSLVQIFPEINTIETDSGKLAYDYLVLAVGTETNYFGMDNVKKNALPMKTINDAINLRNHLLLNVEKAIREPNVIEKERLLNIVIAGGGPTGVEVAGMLAEMRHNIAAKEYPETIGVRSRIYLVNAAPELLSPMSRKAQEEAFRILRKLGVVIMLNTSVKDYQDGQVLLGDGGTIPTNALIWASGVTGRELPGLPASAVGRSRRVLVDENNKIKDTDNIYAIGDICYQTSDVNYPNGHPQLAQVAIQQGEKLAENFKKMDDKKPLSAFAYHDRGSMAIIAKYKAVADLPKVFFKGFFAWFIWLFVHIIPIAGFRNKIKLAFSWFWSFVTNDPTLRLIIRPRKQDTINDLPKEQHQVEIKVQP